MKLAIQPGRQAHRLEVATALSLPEDETKRALDAMVEREIADIEITDEGVIVYTFDSAKRLGTKHTSQRYPRCLRRAALRLKARYVLLYLLTPRPALEAIAVAGPLKKQPTCFWKAVRIAPHACQSIRGFGDEILKVAAPASAVIAQKHQLVRSGYDNPPSKMNGVDRIQKPRPKHLLGGNRDKEEGQTQSQPSKQTRLQRRNGGQMVLWRPVFVVLNDLQVCKADRFTVWNGALLQGSEHEYQRCKQEAKQHGSSHRSQHKLIGKPPKRRGDYSDTWPKRR